MQSLTITKSVINSQAVSELLVLNATIKKTAVHCTINCTV